MIIRSQDKHNIETFDRAYVDYGCFTVYINGLPFGTYSTEEKAIKVLDMIQQEFCDYGENGAFNMPSDEEVEV